MTQKTLRVDAQLADRNLLHGSPLARGESCEQDSFLDRGIFKEPTDFTFCKSTGSL